jgi:glutamate synthase (NADPH/NADH) large chain
MAMVELEPVPEEDDILERCTTTAATWRTRGVWTYQGDMTRHDEERLFQLISNHRHYTGSTGPEILDNWADFRPKFRKVMPVEYRRALEDMERMRMGVAAE